MVKITKVRKNIGQLNTFLFRNTQEGRKKIIKIPKNYPWNGRRPWNHLELPPPSETLEGPKTLNHLKLS